MKKLHKKVAHDTNTLEAFANCEACSVKCMIYFCNMCSPGLVAVANNTIADNTANMIPMHATRASIMAP